MKIAISPIAHVPTSCKKLMILSRSEYLIIFTPHCYHRMATTVSSPSVRGAYPETRTASSDMPPHHPACMRSQCDAPVALLPPGPPSRLTLERLTTRSSPLNFHRRALNSGPLHLVVSGQLRGTPGSNIRAKPTTRSHSCRPDASVSPLQVSAAAPSVRGGTPRTRMPGVCNHHNTSKLVRGRLRKIWRHASPRRPPATVVDARRAIRVEGIFRILLHHQKL